MLSGMLSFALTILDIITLASAVFTLGIRCDKIGTRRFRHRPVLSIIFQFYKVQNIAVDYMESVSTINFEFQLF